MVELWLVSNFAGGVLLVLFGLWVATLRPRRRATLAFAVFCVTFGAVFFFQYAGRMGLPVPVWGGLPRAASAGLAAVAAVLVGLWFPRPVEARERRLLLVAGLVGAAYAATTVLFTVPAFPTIVSRAGIVTDGLFTGSLLFVGALVALRYPTASAWGGERPLALMGAALLLLPGLLGGTLTEPRGHYRIQGLVAYGLLLFIAALWLRASSVAKVARPARNVALVTLAVPLISLGERIVSVPIGLGGVARAATVAILAYAILRHQLLGLDVKVKWTVKQGTVAAAFVGVFFVVSESASTFFAGSVGPYLGIAAAGLLVFAIAPLQRVAERVASAAMPGVKAASTMTGDERLDAYADAVHAAWADGTVSRDERLLLDRMRSSLGIAAEDAMRVESEAARGEGVATRDA
ncbi:MAG: hypothetical protein ACT4PT_14570 [Methanobacteriota archaeon]